MVRPRALRHPQHYLKRRRRWRGDAGLAKERRPLSVIVQASVNFRLRLSGTFSVYSVSEIRFGSFSVLTFDLFVQVSVALSVGVSVLVPILGFWERDGEEQPGFERCTL